MSKYNEAQKKWSMDYEKANIRRVVIKLNINSDQDLIERTETLKSLEESIQAEVKVAWREYIARH